MSLQSPPSNIGKRGFLGEDKVPFTTLDEIRHLQSTDPNKAIYLQKVQFERDQRIEYRMAYWVKNKNDDWQFGRNAPLIPPEDLKAIVEEAERKG